MRRITLRSACGVAATLLSFMSVGPASGNGVGPSTISMEQSQPENTSTSTQAKFGNVTSQPSRAVKARFNEPRGIAHDASGNLYVVDSANDRIRKIAPDGVVTTVAGKLRTPGNADGVRTHARFNMPIGIAADSSGNLYVADTGNNTIRKITPEGRVTTLAGTAGARGSVDGVGAAARFDQPSGVAVDAAGNLYVTDTINRSIRKIAPDGSVSTLAGRSGTRGNNDGDATTATFLGPMGITIDAAANLYITDVMFDMSSILTRDLTLIRKITPTGDVTTLAGSIAPPPPASNVDGVGSNARFLGSTGITINAANNLLFVADTENRAVRRVTLAGEVTTLAVPVPPDSPIATQSPSGITADSAGNLYFTDISNNIVRKIAPDGTVTTIAGTPSASAAQDAP